WALAVLAGWVAWLPAGGAQQEPKQPDPKQPAPPATTAPAAPTLAGNLFYVLNPNQDGALSVVTGAALTIPQGTGLVFSRHAKSVRVGGGASVQAKEFALAGGAEVEDPTRVVVPAKAQIPEAKDPLASVLEPNTTGMRDFGSVEFGNQNRSKRGTLMPGIYDRIRVSFDNVVDMKPGVYVLTGALDVGLGGRITGPDVLIYDEGKFGVGTNGRVILTAPRDGPYKGIALFMSRGNREAVWISGSGTAMFTGAVYLPTGRLWVTTNARVTCTHLLADTVRLDSTGQLAVQ